MFERGDDVGQLALANLDEVGMTYSASMDWGVERQARRRHRRQRWYLAQHDLLVQLEIRDPLVTSRASFARTASASRRSSKSSRMARARSSASLAASASPAASRAS